MKSCLKTILIATVHNKSIVLRGKVVVQWKIQVPFIFQEKRHWRRYIYLWINYALYEELEERDFDRTRQVYEACLEIIPHKKFTFAKIWLMLAHFHARQKNLKVARITLVSKSPEQQ